MVIQIPKLPAPGETVLGGSFFMNPGGKGANQAVAAVRLANPSETSVVFVANVGNDLFGQQAREQFVREGLQTDFVTTDASEPSGVALIGVDAQGENSIMVASGANARLSEAQVAQALWAIPDDSVVLLQLETPLATVAYAVAESRQRGMRVILNPAPAQPVDAATLAGLHLITPNETEAERLTGIRVIDEVTAEKAARQLHMAGVPHVVITLGARGAYLSTPSEARLIEAPVVQAVDTTAAGDCFNGALAVALAEGRSLQEAVTFAIQAASLSVTRLGAQASMPYRKEVDASGDWVS